MVVVVVVICVAACVGMIGIGIIEGQTCANTCKNQKGGAKGLCIANCTSKAILNNPVDAIVTAACAFCLCEIAIKNPVACFGVVKKILQKVIKIGGAE